MKTKELKEQLLDLLLPYFDLFKACEIADDIIKQARQGKRQFLVKISYTQDLEINLR